MMTRFKTLLALEVAHDYYGGVCGDVGFVVPDETARLLRGAGLWAKSVEGALRVFYRADDGGTPVTTASGKTLRFGLVARSPQLASVTEGFDPSAGALQYKNVAAPAALDDPATRAPLTDSELRREGAFGVADLRIDASFYTTPPTFRATLRARLETQRYYVVVRGFSNGEVDLLSVKDNGFGEPDRPEVKFAKVPPADQTADEKARVDLLGADGGRVLLFRSIAAVARRQPGRKRIQLLRNADPLIEHLPQPGRDRGTADLIIHLSKSTS